MRALPECDGPDVDYRRAIEIAGSEEFAYVVHVCDHPVPSNGRDYDPHWRLVRFSGMRQRITWPARLSFAARLALEAAA